jgi:phosphatidylglycerophosphate synthase
MVPHKTSYYVVNGLTMYRLVSAPFLLLALFAGQLQTFKLLVSLSFLTDALDGPLARRFKVTTEFGSRLDSVADDATVLVCAISVWFLDPGFIREHWVVLAALTALFVTQTVAAIVAYHRVTSFHTYLAKIAAVSQAVFFLIMFFGVGPLTIAFYITVIITALELLEEIILVIVLSEWKANVKGLYWVLRMRNLQLH